MTERYDDKAAAHYSAYRPPLHQIILQRVLFATEPFAVGLDVGSGTGYSAIALARHCARVCAIDPSAAMLSRASAHPNVQYLRAIAERIPLASRAVDVVTFAGSLFYPGAASVSDEVRRVCRGGGLVLVYDFEVLLDDLLGHFGVKPAASASAYDHRANFSGAAGFGELLVGSDRVRLELTSPQLAHVFLSDSHRFDSFTAKYGLSDPFPSLVHELQRTRDRHAIEADIYFSKYCSISAAL